VARGSAKWPAYLTLAAGVGLVIIAMVGGVGFHTAGMMLGGLIGLAYGIAWLRNPKLVKEEGLPPWVIPALLWVAVIAFYMARGTS
jgi:hypothetical protein